MDTDITFKCTGCAKCCSSHGHVYLSSSDCVRLAEHFDLSVTKFKKEYCAKTHGEVHLKYPEADCFFLKQGKCSVYEARPEQCRTWPYWAENFSNGKLKSSMAAYCSGIKRC